MPGSDVLAAFRETAAKFAKAEVRPIIMGQGRDGDLEQVPNIIKKAAEAGIVASPDAGHPGFEYGVWGRASINDGPALSLTVLEEIAVECAGVAAIIHAAGLGSAELGPPITTCPAVAFVCGNRRAFPWFPEYSGKISTWSPVLLPPECDGVVLYGWEKEGKTRLLAPPDELDMEELSPRAGLGALRIVRLRLGSNITGTTLEPGDASALGIRWLLGIAAIASGTARGALNVAMKYATQRVQGGKAIKEQPAVQLLLGEAASMVWACRAYLKYAIQEGEEPDALGRAIAARFQIMENSVEATTACLQVLGGYGYMEDYGIEKRLRDLMTLRGIPPARDDLIRMIHASFRER